MNSVRDTTCMVLKGEFSVGLLIAGTGLAGMRQRDLIQWYVSQQNEKNSYSSVEAAAAEISKIKAIIEVYACFTFLEELSILSAGMLTVSNTCTVEFNSKRGPFDSGG